MARIPTSDEILEWISNNPTLTSKRDIAKAFGNGTALCFLVGAFCSALAGFVGMRTATAATASVGLE